MTKQQKILALEKELVVLDEAEYYAGRSIHLGFKFQKDRILEELKKMKSQSD